MLRDEPGLSIVGLAASGEELLEHLYEWNPNVVTLDLSMPGIGGLATLDRILAWRRVPVVILSGHSTREMPLAVEALHRGASDFIDKQDFSLVDFHGLRTTIVQKLRTLTFSEPRHPERSRGTWVEGRAMIVPPHAQVPRLRSG